MSDDLTEIDLEITPESPETVASVKAELLPLIRASLQEAGQEDLLTTGQIRVEPEKTFPVDGAILIGLGFLSKVAYDIFKAVILPRIKARWGVQVQPKKK